jgi:hypothetical protein
MELPEPDPDDLFKVYGVMIREYKFRPKEFSQRYEGYLNFDEICRFENDPSWLTVRTAADLIRFRGGAFVEARAEDMPPIVVVTAPTNGICCTRLGEGRGRVNFAKATGARLHVWHLIHKDCAASEA